MAAVHRSEAPQSYDFPSSPKMYAARKGFVVA